MNFLKNRVNSLDYHFTSRVNDSVDLIAAQEDPASYSSVIEYNLFVTRPDKMIDGFEAIYKLRQIQFIKLEHEFADDKILVRGHFIYSKKLLGVLNIRCNTYETNRHQHDFLMDLASCQTNQQFREKLVQKLTDISCKNETYLPWFDQNKWNLRVQELKQEFKTGKQAAQKKAD